MKSGTTGNAARGVYFNGTSNNVKLWVNGGTIDMSGHTIIGFGGTGNGGTAIIKDGTITGTLFAKNGPGDGSEATPGPPPTYYAIQKCYDFRTHETFVPVGALHERSTDPGKLFVKDLDAKTNGGNPLNATLNTSPKNYNIYYRVGIPFSPAPALRAGELQFDGTEIAVPSGQNLYAYVEIDGFTSREMIVNLSMTPTGIATPSIDGTKAYIADNTLYLPESSAVQVFNVGGQLVLNAVGATVDVSSLSKGIYIVKAGAATFKVVK